ncbi:MAG: M28 family peptidase [Promethearchaeota archaeon]
MKKKEELISKDPELIKKVEGICKDKIPFKHIQAMDYPRMAGTEGEKAGSKYIETKFEEYGFSVNVEAFYIPESSKIIRLLAPIFFFIWCIFSYVNAVYISGVFGLIVTFFILLVPVFLFIAILKIDVIFKKMITRNYQKIQDITKQIEKGIYKKPIKKVKNIYVEYIPEDFEEHLYLTAHYDSTTLKFNLKAVKLCMFFGMFTGIIYILGYLIHFLLLLFNGFNLIGTYLIIFMIILIIFLVSIEFVLFGMIFRTNKSHGAIDNLTGTALVLELARIAKILQPKLKITFIVFSSEEIGLMGSAYHYNTHKKYFKSHNMKVISIDMIGEIPPLTLIEQIGPFSGIPMDPEFNRQLMELGQKLGIKTKFRKFFYPASDFANWFLNGYRANWIMTPSKYLHSSQDVALNVNQDLLNDCLKLFTAYLLINS